MKWYFILQSWILFIFWKWWECWWISYSVLIPEFMGNTFFHVHSFIHFIPLWGVGGGGCLWKKPESEIRISKTQIEFSPGFNYLTKRKKILFSFNKFSWKIKIPIILFMFYFEISNLGMFVVNAQFLDCPKQFQKAISHASFNLL